MKHLTLILAVAAGLALSPMAMAQTPNKGGAAQSDNCGAIGAKGQKTCAQATQKQTQGKSAKSAAKSTDKQKASSQKANAPKVGASAGKATSFRQGKSSRFPNPSQGQEYRVMNDHLVLVDKQSSKIVKVLGLLSTLVN